MSFSESVVQVQSGELNFSISVLKPNLPKSIVIFAAGRGGSPARHLQLLRTLAANGSTIVAPHFDMIPGHIPTKEQLETRIYQLEVALSKYDLKALAIVGVGHSIGATLLLALAGAKAITFSGDIVEANIKHQFDGLVLLAPATDFFLHPGALHAVNSRIFLRTGGKDIVTPPGRAILLEDLLKEKNEVTFVLDENAGHFSYMDQLPPNVNDTLPEREKFLSALTTDVALYITSIEPH